MKNVYQNVGYWPDELYRFGIVFIYENNILSPVFNIQGCDLNDLDPNDDNAYECFFKEDGDRWDQEPDDFFFNKSKRMNSKGVIRLPKKDQISVESSVLSPNTIRIKFDFKHISIKNWKDNTYEDGIADYKEYLRSLNIKGFFFVRQKRIPTIIAQGVAVGLTGRYNGCIPVIKDGGTYVTKSFLGQNRLLKEYGSDVIISSNVTN